VREVECDIVLGAMVGSAGSPDACGGRLGRDVALANKETLSRRENWSCRGQEQRRKAVPVDSETGSLAVPSERVPAHGLRVFDRTSSAHGLRRPFRTWTRDAT